MPVRRLSKEELETKLAPYKCKMRAAFAPGVELWVTGWDEPFTLSPEDGLYDEFQYRRVLVLISKTMPPGWQSNNG
jgi:hypothetical protein